MRPLALAAILAVAACDKPDPAADEATRLEQEYRLVGSDKTEQCRVAEEARDAWRRTLNAEKYDEWKRKADVACFLAARGF